MSTEGSEPFSANEADRLEQQEEVTEGADQEPEEHLNSSAREASEADVVEQAQSVYGDDDYPRGPIDEERG